MANFKLKREQTGLLVIDVQEKIFRIVDRNIDVLHTLKKAIKGFQILNIPIVVSEQYPEGLGHTVASLQESLGKEQKYWAKTSFSCAEDSAFKQYLLSLPISQWCLVGIEAHVCVLQTAKDLLALNKQVVVLNDAITSRSIYDFSTAIAEMRDCGVRISSTETVLFELVANSKAAEFKKLSELIKTP